ncbi:helix-turn-helix domain-containing protein [Catenuloplanes atrovinosus]|uniref:AraC-like DNA-binding protein n=1 Tax=Catenuloplanes atrovinosus TaxID=137266 RepID=A0AAE3YX33_9ACTN|nr:helix-turn-helix transcriptional regulator [Catenuloplanes atrovinosus]MDR7280822.1 AraC-like DNA-binding protein [Catenuloplanes atrovinosus]
MTATALGQTRQATTSTRGLLGARDYRVTRLAPSDAVSELVERHWLVDWDLPDGRTSRATLLPHPCVNLTWLPGTDVMINGVGRGLFTYPLAGRGFVFGVKFRPGGFAPFWPGQLAELTDRVRPLDRAGELRDALAAARGPDEMAAAVERHLLARWPAPDPAVALVGRIIRVLLHDREVRRVDEVAARFGLSARSLQRLFRAYVGVTPKAVLSRYRLHEAAERLADPDSGGPSQVAADLGYFDQSHFIRDFTRVLGETPGSFEYRHSGPAPRAAAGSSP